MLTADEWDALPYLTRVEVTGGRRGVFRFVNVSDRIVVELDVSGGMYLPCLPENVMPLGVVERLAELAELAPG